MLKLLKESKLPEKVVKSWKDVENPLQEGENHKHMVKILKEWKIKDDENPQSMVKIPKIW